MFEWKRKNIENYLLVPDAWIQAATGGQLFQPSANGSESPQTAVIETITKFFRSENLTLPEGQDRKTTQANIFKRVDGKDLFFGLGLRRRSGFTEPGLPVSHFCRRRINRRELGINAMLPNAQKLKQFSSGPEGPVGRRIGQDRVRDLGPELLLKRGSRRIPLLFGDLPSGYQQAHFGEPPE